jgi:hypothetical protein
MTGPITRIAFKMLAIYFETGPKPTNMKGTGEKR